MPQPDAECGRPSSRRPPVHPPAQTRIDPGHALRTAPPQAPAAVAACPSPQKTLLAKSADDVETTARQVHAQAAQLAEHLRTRQRHVDHREARLNAQMAQVETDVRNARLLFGQRHAELEVREQELQKRLARLAAAETSLEQLRQRADEKHSQRELSLGERERQASDWAKRLQDEAAALKKARRDFEIERRQVDARLAHRMQQIDAHRELSQQQTRRLLLGLKRHRAAIEAQAPKMEERARQPSLALLEREKRAARQAEELNARQAQLEAAEIEVGAARAETERLRQALLRDRRRTESQILAQRERLEAEYRCRLNETEAKQQALARHGEQVDRSRVSLDQLRGELGQMHRETLELRLATEQLWAQLSGSAPPATLTQSLGQVRAKLTEEYREANAELSGQKQELEEIRGQLAEQHEKLVAQKRAMDVWTARQREEILTQADRLVARERQLERERSQRSEEARQWQSRELDYQQAIRRLRARLDESEATLGAA
jgi:hypothetical protein